MVSFAEFAPRVTNRVRMAADTVTIDRIPVRWRDGQMPHQLQVRRADCPQLS
jgi:hypothetical protein